VSTVLEKKQLSPGRVIRAMKRVVLKEYKTNFDKTIKGYTKLLNELDRLEARKAQIADLTARLKEKPNVSKQKKLQRMEKEYLIERKAWDEKERKLLTLEPKGDAKSPDA
jgi:predicted nuclease with TOPRIM domain